MEKFIVVKLKELNFLENVELLLGISFSNLEPILMLKLLITDSWLTIRC